MAVTEPVTHVVLVHGFTQTPAAWDAVRADLEARGAACTAPWLPGHGPDAPAPSGWDAALDALAAACTPPSEGPAATAAGARVAWVGYSMGARLALGVALRHPSLVASLVLVSGTAGLGDEASRAARRADDEALARRIETVGVPTFVDEWLARPMFAGLDPAAARAEDRRVHGARGLAGALRALGTGAQPDCWPALERLGVPTLLVAGARDAKFADVARRMHARIPASRCEVLDGLGHAVPLEGPRVLAALVAGHLGLPG